MSGGAHHGELFRNMAVLACGTVAAKLVGFLSIAVLTRLYSPEQFGLFSLFLSAIALASPFTTLRYAAALPLPRRDTAATQLLAACLLILLASCLALSALLAGFAQPVFQRLKAPELAALWPLLVLAIATAGAHEVFSTWAVREKRFTTLAQAELSQSLLGSGLKIGLAWVGSQRFGLMLGHVLAQLCACLCLVAAFSPTRRRLRSRLRLRRIGMAMRRHASFPLLRMPSQVLLVFSMQAPVLFISALHGTGTAGQLGLALSTLAVPIALIGQPMAQAYLAEIARIGARDAARIRAISHQLVARLLVMGALPTLVLVFGAPALFAGVFGQRWQEAGQFAAALAVYLLAWFVANPLTHALSVFGRNDLFLRFNAVRAGMTVVVFMASHRLNLSALAAVQVYGASMAIYYVLNTVAILRVMRPGAPAPSRST